MQNSGSGNHQRNERKPCRRGFLCCGAYAAQQFFHSYSPFRINYTAEFIFLQRQNITKRGSFMAIGISTSCLYPQSPDASLEALGAAGVRTCEIFLNSISETTADYAKELNRIKDYYGMRVTSVHPFSSFAETTMFFSEYKKRFDDALDFYKRDFEVAAALGAKMVVIHGSRLPGKITHAEYFERFSKIYETGMEYGIMAAQENVNLFLSQSPDFLKEMRSALGDNFKMVFDVKQTVRAGFDTLPFAEEFKNEIVHVHLSDHDSANDCLPPSKGNFPFGKLFDIMKSADYGGDYVIELYRHNFDSIGNLTDSLAYLLDL